LERYVGAARESKADVIVRVTADCPLIDPMITDQVIETLEIRPAEIDYAANIVEGHRTYPRGLDTEVFFRDTLERVYRLARTEPSVEHVTYFIRSERPDLFLIQPVTDLEDNSDLRWCVDESEDMDMVRRLYQELQLEQHSHSYQEILSYVRAHPDISAMNTRVRQKTV
jgi:spore coat polysaccharide biosynthesis protein SpsF